MVNMTDSLFAKINTELAEWDPIGVPRGIAEDEYRSYVPLLLAAYNQGQDVETFLKWVYEERIGLDVNEEFLEFTSPVATRITQLLQVLEKESL